MNATTKRNTVENFLYFAYNYPHNFIAKVWADDNRLKEHFEVKFSGYYEKLGSRSAVVELFFSLDHENRARLLDWVDNNYKY